jgi:acetamidase/formamidase
LVEDALIFFGDPHAAISDGIITGTGIDRSMNVRARVTLLKVSQADAYGGPSDRLLSSPREPPKQAAAAFCRPYVGGGWIRVRCRPLRQRIRLP